MTDYPSGNYQPSTQLEPQRPAICNGCSRIANGMLKNLPFNTTMNVQHEPHCNVLQRKINDNTLEAQLDLSNPQRGLLNLDKACDPHRKIVLNIVKDYRKLQNEPDPGNIGLRQNINCRYVRIENSGRSPIIVGIDTKFDDLSDNPNGFDWQNPPHQRKLFILQGGESKDLGVNQQGDTQQYVFLYDYKIRKLVGTPYAIDNKANLLSIRQGMNLWFVVGFHRTGF